MQGDRRLRVTFSVFQKVAVATMWMAFSLFMTGKAQESNQAYPDNAHSIHGLYLAAMITMWIAWVFMIFAMVTSG